jgi:uncharacterized membrane protein HdeD (DUF308 family)
MYLVEKKLSVILARHWWIILLRGLLAIVLGVLAWLSPGIMISTLVLFFGLYALVDGILGIWTAITGGNKHESWWVLILWGLTGIGIGILTFLAPAITTMALLFYIAIWAVVTGVLEIVVSIHLRNEIEGEWLLILAGLLSVFFGIVIMVQPGAGALTLLWLIALYAIIFGIILVVLAFKARTIGK